MPKKKSTKTEVPFRAVYKNLRTGETVAYKFSESWMITPTIVLNDKDESGNIVAYTLLVLLYADAILEGKTMMNNNVKTTTELKFSSAKVVTSKFLMLKENLEKKIAMNHGLYGPGPGNGFTDHTTEANFMSLYNAFGELCELLHQLTTEE